MWWECTGICKGGCTSRHRWRTGHGALVTHTHVVAAGCTRLAPSSASQRRLGRGVARGREGERLLREARVPDRKQLHSRAHRREGMTITEADRSVYTVLLPKEYRWVTSAHQYSLVRKHAIQAGLRATLIPCKQEATWRT